MSPSSASLSPSTATRRENLRLTFYSKGFPPRETGGPVQVARRLLQELLRDPAYRVTLLAQTDSSEEEIRSSLGAGDRLEVVKLRYYPSAEDVRIFPRILRILRASDAVHFNEFPIRHLPYLALAKLRGLPLVFSLHGRFAVEAPSFLGPAYPIRFLARRSALQVRLPTSLRKMVVWSYRRVARAWTAVVVPSHEILQGAQTSEQLNPAVAHVIPHGVDLPMTQPEAPMLHDGPPRVAFVGKLEEVKGPDLLFAALELLARANRAVDVRVAGAGSLEPRLREWAPGLAPHRIEFLGSTPHEEALQVLAQADIVVVPSRYESFSLVALEAIAAGRAVVATRVGGIPEILHDPENALLVEPDGSALARGIDALLSQPERMREMGRASAKAAKRYRWSDIARQYDELYRSLLRPGGRHPER